MNRRQRFSLRKYKFGLASVLLGTALVFGASQVSANEQSTGENQAQTQEIKTELKDDKHSNSTTDLTTTNGIAPVVGEKQEAETSKEDASKQDAKVETPVDKTAESQESRKDSAVANEENQGVVQKETTVDASPAPATEKASNIENKEAQATTAPKTTGETATTEKEQEKAESAKPNSLSSNDIITVPKTWKAGYKGTGTVVAIIDSGLDLNHEVLRISDPSKAKFKNKEAIEAAKKAAGIDYGKWYSDKVVYAYDYFDGTDKIKEAERTSHGMHVTGIAAGNPDKEAPNGEKVYGVAPEAQVMFMRVFSDRQKTTSSALYVKAIDDAVALGADAINMSLGSSTGSMVDAGSDIVDAIKRARAKGVSVLISAGNSNTFGNGYSKPLAENPDYGLVGNPSTVEDSISVASVNNKTLTTAVFEVKGLEGNAGLHNGKFDYNQPEADKDFEKGKEYEYVEAGLGREEDFAKLDLTGKLALIQRGAMNFSEKIKNARKHGAVGALIYNNVEGANINMSIDGEAKKIPSVFISKQYGEALKSGNYKIVFNGKMDNRPSDVANQLSDFSSWGVTTDGQLKPDVTAPGGNIYSSFNDNTYGSISGTSMAAPHVTGVAVLVKEYLQKHHPELTPEQVSETVKALIMSTAKPHVNKDTGTYTSPRQQGSGIVDTAAAVSTDLYVTGENGYPSVTLGNVGDQFTFKVTVHNISDTDRTLKMVVNTNTDEVQDGKFTLRPRKLTETVWPEVTVKAHSSQTVTVKVDARKFAAELSKQMPNGYFLEGFVRFVDPADDGDIVSLAFMGFRGEFQNLPAVEKPIYNLVREGKNGFYTEVDKENPAVNYSNDATYLATLQNDLLVSQGQRQGRRITVLGIEQNAEGKHVLQLDEKGNVRIAISPNDDGNKDLVEYKTVALRNLVNLRATVYAATDTKHEHPIWEGDAKDLRKNYFDGDSRNLKSYILDNTAWRGQDFDGNTVADGLYDYVISYTPDVPGAKEQHTTFKIQIDTQKPVITSGYIRFKDGNQEFVARKPKDVGQGGILSEKVFYLTPFDQKGTMVLTGKDQSGTRALENTHLIKANADGSYTLPKDVDKANIYYLVEDYAGNVDYISLAELVRDQNSGRVKIALKDAKTNQDIDTLYVYRIKNSKGQYVDVDKTKAIHFLQFGHYTAEIFSYDRTELKFISALSQEFDLTEENSFQTITFLANLLEYAPVSVSFNQAVPKTTTVVLKGEDGTSITLPAEKYGQYAFGKKVATGRYTVQVTLPTGYELLEDLVSLLVKPGRNNALRLSVVSKLALIAAVNQQKELVETSRYFNSSADKRKAYDQAFQVAQSALSSKLKQELIDGVLASLEAAGKALDGKDSNVTALKEAMKAYYATTKTGRYANAKEKVRRAYDRAFQEIALLAVDSKVKQDQIDQSLIALATAKSKLNGKATDFSSLKKLVKDERLFQEKNARFIYADKKEKAAYLLTFKEAQELLKDPGASQEDVKDAITALKQAKRNLHGKKPKAKRHP